jgi:phosphatidylserine/phosphatidylglycerophosphate/cardiolipin synthase-like enzyme
MGSRRRLRAGILGLLALVGCDGERLGASPSVAFRLDSGFFARDTGVDVGFPEAGAWPDLGVRPDGGRRDGGPAERCVCPVLPTACPATRTPTPVFSPGGTAFQALLLEELACAERSLRIAIYQATWPCLVDAIAARLAAAPELTVQLVVDDDQCPREGGVLGCALATLDGHPRVQLVDDGRSRYMHHKFVVTDDREVWVSSANFTDQSFCADDNDALRVIEPAIVAAYAAEFDRLFATRDFGPKPPAPPVSAGPYTVYFGPVSPLDAPAPWFQAMIAAVDAARVSVEVCTSAWTRPELADAMLAARARGVAIRALVPRAYADAAPAQRLIDAGVPVRVENVHSKWLVVDGRRVVTGSANWSQNAWANNENSLWVDSATVAAAYVARFEQVWAGASGN